MHTPSHSIVAESVYVLLARSGGFLLRLFSGLVGQLFPGHENVDREALSPSISTFQSIQMGDIKSPRDKL